MQCFKTKNSRKQKRICQTKFCKLNLYKLNFYRSAFAAIKNSLYLRNKILVKTNKIKTFILLKGFCIAAKFTNSFLPENLFFVLFFYLYLRFIAHTYYVVINPHFIYNLPDAQELGYFIIKRRKISLKI